MYTYIYINIHICIYIYILTFYLQNRNTNEALSNRMDALDILAQSAVVLSAIPHTTPPPPAPSNSNLYSESHLRGYISFASHSSHSRTGGVGGGGGGEEEVGSKDIYHPLSGKTRRWSDRYFPSFLFVYIYLCMLFYVHVCMYMLISIHVYLYM